MKNQGKPQKQSGVPVSVKNLNQCYHMTATFGNLVQKGLCNTALRYKWFVTKVWNEWSTWFIPL